jgi:hypothetical protein
MMVPGKCPLLVATHTPLTENEINKPPLAKRMIPHFERDDLLHLDLIELLTMGSRLDRPPSRNITRLARKP